MKALTRAALVVVALCVLVSAGVTGALAAPPADGDMPGNGYGHCRNFPNNGHQGEDSRGRGHQRDGGNCDDAPWNQDGSQSDNGGETRTNGNAGGDAGGTPADPHDGDMPGNGYGHCRNFPNDGHQGEDSRGRGHLRDGGNCDDAPWNRGDDTGGEDEPGDGDSDGEDELVDGEQDELGEDDTTGGGDSGVGEDTDGQGVGVPNRGGKHDDSSRGDVEGDSRSGAADASGRVPVGSGGLDTADGTFPLDGARGADEAYGGAFTAPETAATQESDSGATGAVAGDGALPGAPGADGAPPAAVPTRIDAGFGFAGVTAQSGLAAVAMAAALAGAFASLVRRSSWSAR